ncbi:hypothetical protein IE53DRAFT_346135 [Violaceomyces palustris]|uniref:Uncharacterized protein n=1 Tax=Violaceomyces palustris TaxID=1673888 RepID=A0ACD0NU33_9BASI|nr:hypothetical protein IE53DRAFT_346135 [Violaceomyces palustris]
MRFPKHLLFLSLSIILLTTLTSSLVESKRSSPSQKASSDASLASQRILQAYLSSPSKPYLELDSESFRLLVSSPERDYHAAVLMTANDPAIKCQPCLNFQPEFDNVAKNWRKKSNVNREKLVMAKIEFTNGREVFRQFGLQHAPALYIFPPPTPSNPTPEPIAYDFNRVGFEGKELASTLSQTLNVPFKFSRPLNWKLIAVTSTTAVLVAVFGFVVSPHLGSLFKSSKPFWLVCSLFCIVIFTSGQMWNRIRGAPYIMVGQGGKPEYFAGGFQNQYGAETQIIAAMYALLAFSFIALTSLVPNQRDPTRQRAGVYVWSAIFLCTFSLLLVIFRMKNPSYPFRLFF